MSPTFVEFVRRGKNLAGSQEALGTLLGVSKHRISNVLAGRGYPFGELNCVKLARLLGEPDWVVLRSANKAALADLLEQAYGDRPVKAAPLRRDSLDGLSPLAGKYMKGLARLLRRKMP